MFTGWLNYAGNTIANNAQTVAYASRLLPGTSVRDCDYCPDFHEVVGDKPYTTPFVDQPEWYDAGNPDSWDFYGFLLLDTEGVEDGTLTATTTELTTDGGYASAPRHAGREMVFKGLLLGGTQAAMSYGMSWLRKALEGDQCRSNGACTGDHLCYLTDCPEMCEDAPDLTDATVSPLRMCPLGEVAEYPDACVIPYERHMYKVSTIDAPTRTAETRLSAGWMWEVEFTLYAGVAYAYGAPLYVGTTDLSDSGETGEVVRTNLSPNPRGNLRTDVGWESTDQDVETWGASGYTEPDDYYVGGFVRENYVLDPRASRSDQWLYEPADGEESTRTSVLGTTDGPPTPGGRVDSYQRVQVDAAPPDPAGTDGVHSLLETRTSALTPGTGEAFTGSLYARRSTPGRAQAVLTQSDQVTAGPIVPLTSDTWTRLSATALGIDVENQTRTNLCPNPRYIGVDTTSGGGSASWSQEDVPSGGPDDGGYTHFDVSADQTGFVQMGGDNFSRAAVAAGVVYTASLYMNASRVVPTLRVRIVWLDAAGATGLGYSDGDIVSSPPVGWGRYYVTAEAPVGAVYARIIGAIGYIAGGSDNLVTGDTIDIAQRMIEEGTALAPYFDGDSTSTDDVDYMWTGEPNASTSLAVVSNSTARLGVRWYDLDDGSTLDATGALIDDLATLEEYFDGSRPADGKFRYQWQGNEGQATTRQIPAIRDTPERVGFQWIRAASDAEQSVWALDDTSLVAPVGAGEMYGARMWVYVPDYPEPSLAIQMRATWRNSQGEITGARTQLDYVNYPTAGWHLLEGKTGIAPAAARTLGIQPVWVARAAGDVAVREGQTIGWGARIIEATDIPPDYFDGDTPDDRRWDFEWVGVQWDSPSTMAVQPDTFLVDEVDCQPAPSGFPALEDPHCLVPEPPRPPAIEDNCLVNPPTWRRRQLDLPEHSVPEWHDAVPIIRVRTGSVQATQVRFRFYANPFGRLVSPQNVGCDFCGEFVVSYVPPNSLLVIDGIEQTAWVETYNAPTATAYRAQQLTATHLLYSSDGGPMSWPTLSCDLTYSMTVDTRGEGGTTEEAVASLCLAIREG